MEVYLQVSDTDVHDSEGKAHGVALQAGRRFRSHVKRHGCIQQLEGDKLSALHYDLQVNSHHPQIQLHTEQKL